MPSEQVFVERFAFAASVRDEPPAPVAETPAVEPSEPRHAPRRSRSSWTGAPTRCGTRRARRSSETARRAGLRAPFSCESGSCATCMARLEVGEAKMRVNNALMPDEVDEGWVLTCQGLPTSPTAKVVYES